MVSGQLAHWGEAGPGRWITVYADAQHVFMVVAGPPGILRRCSGLDEMAHPIGGTYLDWQVMSFGHDSLPTAVLAAQDRDLRPIAEASAEALELDARQRTVMESFLHEAWFFGVRTGHRVMVETKMGREGDPREVVSDQQGAFRDLMERLGEALNTTVSGTVTAWSYLGQAWIAGADFWEVEIAARSIEARAGGFEEALRRLEE